MAKAVTCHTCPSYMDHEAAIRKRFGKATGSPMCGVFGHVLGRPGHPNAEVAEHFASNCQHYGKQQAAVPVAILPRVVNPDTQAMQGATADECGTCFNCSNLVAQNAVMTKYGWPLPICSAKGTLVMKPSKESHDCLWAKKGQAMTDVPPQMELIPEFLVGFKVDDSVKLQALLGDTTIIPPETYQSDIPVEQDDQDAGIRAWRRYADPETGNEYFLPIFRRDYFTPEEQLRIPETGVPFFNAGKPELYVDYNEIMMSFLKDSFTLDYTLALEGEPGNGKTQFGIYLAWLMQVPFEKFAITPEMNVEQFIGHPSVKGGEDYFEKGRLPQRWVRPGVGVSDEFTSGPDEVFFVYRGIFDLGVINIDYKGGMMLRKHDYFFHMVTGNPSWDMRNIGTRELSDADAQRLSFKWVEEPPEAVLRFMLKRHCTEDDYEISDETLDQIIKIRADIRNLSEQGIYPGTWGTRQDMKVARMTAHYATLVEAYRHAALDHIDSETRKIVIRSIEDMQEGESDSEPF